MGPKELARKECANCIAGERCLKVWISRDLSMSYDQNLGDENGQCNVGDVPCRYFAEKVIPGVKMCKNHPQFRTYMQAVEKYENKFVKSSTARKCKRCRILIPDSKCNQFYCQECAYLKKLESNRKRHRKG